MSLASRSARFTLSVSLRALLLTTCALLALLVSTDTTRAAVDDDADVYAPQLRVARISLLRGDVQILRDGKSKWERARLNMPVLEGDTVATLRGDAAVEIQFGRRNFIRLDRETVLRFITFRDNGIALSLPEGAMTARLSSFTPESEYFEVDVPRSTVALKRAGLYRFDVAYAAQDRVRVSVRDGGRARLYTESDEMTLRDGRSAELIARTTDRDDDLAWEMISNQSFDRFDGWNDERERYLATRLRNDDRERYYDDNVWGAEELDAYGDWTNTNDYGWVWRPRTTVINNYYDWSPYRHGRWIYIAHYGWTWVGDEPWGFTPYHYGRWVYYNNGWCWSPRGWQGYANYNHRHWWRPALVAFVYLGSSYGEHLAWYPLGYRHHDPRYYDNGRGNNNNNYPRTPDRLMPLNARELAQLERTNPAYLRAVSTLPAREFGTDAARARPASTDLARRAVTTESVRGRLPIRPTDGSDANDRNARVDGNARTGDGRSADDASRLRNRGVDNGGGANADRRIARPPSLTRDLPVRETGAGERRIDQPIENVERRTRDNPGRDAGRRNDDSTGARERGVEPNERRTGIGARPDRSERTRLPVRPDDDRAVDNGARTPEENRRPIDRREREPRDNGNAERDRQLERERAERERNERESRDRNESETRERRERDQREQGEREQREREERNARERLDQSERERREQSERERRERDAREQEERRRNEDRPVDRRRELPYERGDGEPARERPTEKPREPSPPQRETPPERQAPPQREAPPQPSQPTESAPPPERARPARKEEP